jgi:tight adherence protein B
MRLPRLLGVTALALAVVAGAGAASSPVRVVEAGGAQFPFRSYVLTLPAATSLTASRLSLTENGTAVRGLSVLSAEAAKQSQFAVVLAVDASNSMRGRPIVAAMAAARAFAAHRNANQQLAIITFDGSVHVVLPFTTSSLAINAALARIPRLGEGTHIYDALERGANLISGAHVQGGSIVLLSDGADVGSIAKPGAVLSDLSARHVRAFTVGLVSSAYDPATLRRLAAQTGASYAEAASPSALTPIFDALGYQLSREYLVSYQSLAGPGAHVHVSVHVAGFPGTVSAQYVTPSLHVVSAPPYRASGIGRIVQSRLTMVLVAFVAAAIFGWGIVLVTRRRSVSLVQRVGSFVSVRRRGEADDLTAARRVDLLQKAEGAFERLRWWPRFKATLELADINASPTQIVLLTLLGTVAAMLLFYLVIGGWGIVLGFAAPFVARMIIQAKLDRKRRTFAEQVPDNLEVLASALRAGHSLVGALSVVVDNSADPSKSEFRRVIAEEQLGVPLEDALGVVVRRMDNRDLDQVALVARLQREAGANAAEVIDRVIETVRSRMELRRLVRTLTAQGRLSRWILTGMPIFLALVLPLVHHGYLDPLFNHGLGRAMLLFASLMVIAGSVVIGKIVNIKV